MRVSVLQRGARFLCAAITVAAFAAAAEAQRARTVATPAPTPPPAAAAAAPAPASVTAKYEGGVTGYMKRQTGTLFFDDGAGRLVFKDKYQREYFSLPYKSFAALWGDTKAARTKTGSVVSSIPMPYGANMLGLLMREKRRYLVVQFDDPDTKIGGVTSFKLENKETLASVLSTLAQKAGMTARGEAYIRPTPTASKP
ncbi:MAG: hypothetical protein LC746_04195 [Acidobacteria bacterium]|nr:hypothetical protein [Acidobacteriota bacterium]